MPAGRQNRQARRDRAADMEQREAADRRIELVEAMNLGKTPGGVDLIAVRQADKLRASRRAAGVEERAYGVAVCRRLKVERVALRRKDLSEADVFATGIALAADDQNLLKRRHSIDDRFGLLPQSGVAGFGGNDKHGGLFGDQKVGDRVGVEQEVYHAGDARDLSAKESRRNPG